MARFAVKLIHAQENETLYYNGGWDPVRKLPTGKGVLTWVDGTCVEHEAWNEIWDAKYEAYARKVAQKVFLTLTLTLTLCTQGGQGNLTPYSHQGTFTQVARICV